MLLAMPLTAQNLKQRPAFRSGETLKCNFYFNWKFIWVKAGGASLIIRDTIFNGQKAQYMSLLSSTNSTADAFFRIEIENSDIHSRLGLEKGRYILLSAHREENIDTEKNFISLFTAINKMAEKNKKAYTGTKPDLINNGYTPCQICN